jgi:hypothetical protein
MSSRREITTIVARGERPRIGRTRGRSCDWPVEADQGYQGGPLTVHRPARVLPSGSMLILFGFRRGALGTDGVAPSCPASTISHQRHRHLMCCIARRVVGKAGRGALSIRGLNEVTWSAERRCCRGRFGPGIAASTPRVYGATRATLLLLRHSVRRMARDPASRAVLSAARRDTICVERASPESEQDQNRSGRERPRERCTVSGPPWYPWSASTGQSQGRTRGLLSVAVCHARRSWWSLVGSPRSKQRSPRPPGPTLSRSPPRGAHLLAIALAPAWGLDTAIPRRKRARDTVCVRSARCGRRATLRE